MKWGKWILRMSVPQEFSYFFSNSRVLGFGFFWVFLVMFFSFFWIWKAKLKPKRQDRVVMTSYYFKLLRLLRLFPLGWCALMCQSFAINSGGRTCTPVPSHAFDKCFTASAPNKSHWPTHRAEGNKAPSRGSWLTSQKSASCRVHSGGFSLLECCDIATDC